MMEKVKLGDICFKKTSNIAQKELEGFSGVYPIYGASGIIKRVDFYHQENDYVAVVKDGAGIGRTMYLPAKSSVIGTLQYLLPKYNIDAKYLYYAVKSRHLEKYYTGAAIPHIYFKDYQNEPILLHDKEHQRIIVSVLDNVQKIIDSRKIELDELDELIKARFVEMFGDLLTSPIYYGIEFGTLGEMVTGGTPSSKHKEYYGGDIPFVTTPCLGPNYISRENAKLFLTSDGVDNSSTHIIPANSLMVGNRIGIGKSSINTCEMCTNQDVLSFVGIDTSKYDLLFLKMALDQYVPYFDSQKRGATIKGIPSDMIKKTLIPDAPVSVQKEYTKFVKEVDKSKSVERNFAHFGRKLYHISSEVQFLLEA